MTISLGVTTSPINTIRKNYSPTLTLDGTLKESCNVDMPGITIEASLADVAKCNYMYIPTFGRYYYITDRISISNKLVEVHGESDPLMSFADKILDHQAVIARGESAYNMYLNDPDFQVYQNPIVQHKIFPRGFNNSYYMVLAVNGNGGKILG